jgi:hypothetical protein
LDLSPYGCHAAAKRYKRKRYEQTNDGEQSGISRCAGLRHTGERDSIRC